MSAARSITASSSSIITASPEMPGEQDFASLLLTITKGLGSL